VGPCSREDSLPQKLSDGPAPIGPNTQAAPIPACWSDRFWCVPDALRFLPDETGLEFASPKAVKAEAQRILPELARETLTDGNHRTFVVSVRDEAGLSAVRMSLTLVVEKGVLDASADRSLGIHCSTTGRDASGTRQTILFGSCLGLDDPTAFRKMALMCSFTAASLAPTSAAISVFCLPAFKRRRM
jgi:hypothetical protein